MIIGLAINRSFVKGWDRGLSSAFGGRFLSSLVVYSIISRMLVIFKNRSLKFGVEVFVPFVNSSPRAIIAPDHCW
jgi:hypothetical protein